MTVAMRIDVTEAGPYIVRGSVPLVRVRIVSNERGESVGWEEVYRYPAMETYTLCRCGQSDDKPFCDGTHAATGFRGDEVAPHVDYFDEARPVQGEGMKLYDAPRLCVGARFCDRAGGVWRLTETSNNPEHKELAIEEAKLCPAGRLVMVLDNEGALEPDYEPSIALIEDPVDKSSGPIWVRGNIPLYSADGTQYELRNRVTLCRCGQSRDFPFCDANHRRFKFNDGHIFD